MKCNFLLALSALVLIFSCTKKEITTPIDATTSQVQTDGMVRWEELPEKFRSAKRVEITDQDRDNIASRTLALNYGPYGNTSNGTHYFFGSQTYPIVTIGLGTYNNITPGVFLIWCENPAGGLILFTSRDPAGSMMVMRTTQPGEYIRGMGGYYGSSINRLEIYTNKAALTFGTVTGTRFVDIPGPGFGLNYFIGGSGITNISSISYRLYQRPWTQLSGSLGSDIAVDLNGRNYLVNSSGLMYYRNASATAWTQMNGTNAVRIAANAAKVYMVNTVGKIYRLSGTSWVETPNACPGGGKDITIDASGKIWVVTRSGYIYTLEGNTWVKQAGSSGSRIAAGGAAGQNSMIWMVNTGGKIYKWNESLSNWDQQAGSDAVDMAVDNVYNTWMTNTAGIVYRYDYSKKDWIELRDVDAKSIASNANKLVMVNTVGKIYDMQY